MIIEQTDVSCLNNQKSAVIRADMLHHQSHVSSENFGSDSWRSLHRHFGSTLGSSILTILDPDV